VSGRSRQTLRTTFFTTPSNGQVDCGLAVPTIIFVSLLQLLDLFVTFWKLAGSAAVTAYVLAAVHSVSVIPAGGQTSAAVEAASSDSPPLLRGNNWCRWYVFFTHKELSSYLINVYCEFLGCNNCDSKILHRVN